MNIHDKLPDLTPDRMADLIMKLAADKGLPPEDSELLARSLVVIAKHAHLDVEHDALMRGRMQALASCNWCLKPLAGCSCKEGPAEPAGYVPVVVESPYAGDIERNMRYVRACMRDCLLRGEAPYASHALYTQPGVLRDEVPEERQHGIRAGFAFRPLMKMTVVYTDLGYSTGMRYGIKHAEEIGHPIEYRTLGGEWAQ